MLRSIRTAVRRFVSGPEHELAAQPVIAGYRRRAPRPLVFALFIALAVGFALYGFGFAVSAPLRMMPFLAPVAALLGLVIWALPAGNYAPVGAIRPLYVTFVIVFVLWPNYLAIAIANLPWVTLQRMALVPLVAVFLTCMSVSPGFRRQLRDILQADPLLTKLIAALVAIQAFSVLISTEPSQSLNQFIVSQLVLTALLLTGAYIFVRDGFAEAWVRVFVVCMAILCLMCLWENKLQALPWAGHIPPFLKIEDPAVQRILMPKIRLDEYRVLGTATTPLTLAELLGLSIPFGMHLLFERQRLMVRISAALYIVLAIHCIVLTGSRLGMVAAFASALFYLLVWALLRWRQHKTSVFGPAVVLGYPIIAVGFLVATFVVGRLRALIWGNSGAHQASTDAREEQWALAIPKIIKRPWGYGLGQAAETTGWTNPAGTMSLDSGYIAMFMDIGIVGFLIFFGLIFRGIWTAGYTAIHAPYDRDVRVLLPIAVSLSNFVLVRSVLAQGANVPLVFMMLGAATALAYKAQALRDSTLRA
jgi:hypothetical protein